VIDQENIMKTYLTVLFAGAVLTSVGFAADTMKPGAHKEECTKRECCRHEHAAASKEAQSYFDAWSRAKWGRNIRATERTAGQLAQASSADLPAACDNPKCCE
jgi:hypothetical protein